MNGRGPRLPVRRLPVFGRPSSHHEGNDEADKRSPTDGPTCGYPEEVNEPHVLRMLKQHEDSKTEEREEDENRW
jgi:hypothetical protein